VLDEATNIGTYSAVMATIEIIIAFREGIATSFGKILFRIATNRAREIEKAFFLLFEITQARRNQAKIFGVCRKHRLIV
jgi:hypothetical protein